MPDKPPGKKTGWRVRNITKERLGNPSQQEPADRVDSQALVVSSQRQPGKFMNQIPHQSHALPSNVTKAPPFNNATPPVRHPDRPDRDQRAKEELPRPPSSPTRAYNVSNSSEPPYSARALLPRPPRKDVPAQYSNNASHHREAAAPQLSEPTLNHNSAENLQSQPPPLPRKDLQRITIDNRQPTRSQSWEPERSQNVESNDRPLGQEVDGDFYADQMRSQQYDAVAFEDLTTFCRVAWDQIVKYNPVLRSLNAHDNQRLQMVAAFEVAHWLLWTEIKRLRKADSDARKELDIAKTQLSETHKAWGDEVGGLIREQEAAVEKKLDAQAIRIGEQYSDQLYGQSQRISALELQLNTKDEELRQFYQGELDRKQTEFSQETQRIMGDYDQLKRETTQEVRDLKKKHESEFEEYKKDSDELLDEEEKKTRAAVTYGEEQLAQLKERHTTEKLSLEASMTVLRERNDQEIKEKDENHMRMLSDLRAAHDKSQKELTRAHQNKEQRLIQEHESGSKTLIDEVHALNKVLLTRDNEAYLAPMFSELEVKQAPDEYVRAKFTEIVQIVDDLSRLHWKADQKVWTDDVLRSIGAKQTQRLLKKGIMQDTIWTILQRHIFCSPFRMFGREGRDLEKKWNERGGTDPAFDNGVYTWPPLEIENERWRYITQKECRKALIDKLTSPVDPRAIMKIGFKNANDAFLAELKGTLDAMIEWGGTEASNVERLAKRIQNVWLELGMYRCRFIIFLRGTVVKGGVEEKVKLALAKGSGGGVELNVVPGLRRHGNVKGVELSRSTIVGGFEGEVVRLGG